MDRFMHIDATLGLLGFAAVVTFFVICALYPFKANRPAEPFAKDSDWGSQ